MLNIQKNLAELEAKKLTAVPMDTVEALATPLSSIPLLL